MAKNRTISSKVSPEEFDALCAVAAKYRVSRCLLIHELAVEADRLYGILVKEKPECPQCGGYTKRMHSGSIPVRVCVRCAQVYYD